MATERRRRYKGRDGGPRPSKRGQPWNRARIPNSGGAGACLSIGLTAAFTAFLLVVIVLATGGWAVYVVGVATAIVGFGAIHYFLWGRLMLQQTAGEREEDELRQRAEAPRSRSRGPTRTGCGGRIPELAATSRPLSSLKGWN